jgi:pimeloyl-ACP methyl ester carboxylesterase
LKQLFYKKAKINFTDVGKGTAVVVLHGYLENLSMWNSFVSEFSKKNRVVAIDLLGHGQSDCLGYVHSMEDQAHVVAEVLNHLKIKKAVLIGHSMGGYVALAYAELYSDNVKGLVLMNSTSRADSDEKKHNRDRAVKAVKQNYINFVKLSITNLFSEENRVLLIDEIEKVKNEALKTPLQGIVAAQEGMKIRKDREVLLHFASYPKMLILGKKDTVLNFEEAIEQIQNTNVQLIAFPDGHMSHIENKDELLIVLLAFLKKI